MNALPINRCLYLSNTPAAGTDGNSKIGGGARSLLTLLDDIPQFGWQGSVICPADGQLTSFLRDKDIPCRTYAFGPPQRAHPIATLQDFLMWRRIIRGYAPRIIHANAPDAARSVALAAGSLRIPVVCHVRFPPDKEDIAWLFRGLPGPAAFIFNSQALRDEVWPALSACCPRSRAFVVHNAVDLSMYEATPRPPDTIYRIGMVANLTPMKAHEDFLRMAARVRDALENVEFWIVGEDTLGTGRQAVLEALVKKLDLGAQVRFLGHREDIPWVFSQLHVPVLTSRIEPFGRVLIEAMAAGRPVVATRVGGIPEVVTEGKTGYLAAAGDTATMARRVLELVNNRVLWETLAGNALQDVRQRFSSDEHARKITTIYGEVLADA